MKKVLLSLIFVVSMFAEFKVGDKIENFILPDQFDNNLTFNSQVKTVIIAFDKDVAVNINDFLKTKDKNFLANHKALFIADISSMPTFVTTMFALPKMRKYPYSVMLIYDDFGKKFNRQENKFTVYKLKDLKIEEILYFSDTKELEKLF